MQVAPGGGEGPARR